MLLAVALLSLVNQGSTLNAPPLTCPVLGVTAPANGPSVDYKGVRYALCCNMCQAKFAQDPNSAITSDKAKGKTIGTFLFDPVSDSRINLDQAKAYTDYNGVRYLFTSDDEKNTFMATPDKFAQVPAKEALYCPVMKNKVSGYAAASGYRDYNGVRYYFCCDPCPTDFLKTPDAFAKAAADYVSDPKPIVPEAAKSTADNGFQPSTFTCSMCGNMISINSPDDMNATCSVCGCGKKCSQCKGN